MPCEPAIIKNVVTVSPDMSVDEAFDVLRNKNVRTAVVTDEKHTLLGIVNFQQIIKGILPFSATMEEGIQDLEFMHAEASDVAEKLKAVKEKKVRDIMQTDIITVSPATTFLEVLFLLYKHGSPVPVVEKGTKKLIGIVTKQSALFNLDTHYGS